MCSDTGVNNIPFGLQSWQELVSCSCVPRLSCQDFVLQLWRKKMWHKICRGRPGHLGIQTEHSHTELWTVFHILCSMRMWIL